MKKEKPEILKTMEDMFGDQVEFMEVPEVDDLHKRGSDHYKTGGVEPIDLAKDGEYLWGACIFNIVKYTYRNRPSVGKSVNPKDMAKIRHYVDMLETYYS